MLTRVIIATAVILLMLVFRKKTHYILIFSLCVFTMLLPMPRGILLFLRWVAYAGFVILGFLYSREGRSRKFILPDILLLFFVVVLLLSYSASINPSITLQKGASVILMYLAVFFGIYGSVDNTDKIYSLLQGLLIFLVLYNALTLFPQMRHFVRGRLGGVMGHPTATAAINVFLLPIAMMNYALTRKKRDLLVIFLIACIIYFTFTRTAFIIMFLSGVFFYSQYSYKRTNIVFISLAAIAAIVVSFFIFGVWLPEKLVRIDNLPLLGGRIEAWRAARDIIAARPLYGFGFGTEQFLFRHFDLRFQKHAGVYFHNSFLGLSAQIGIPFSFIFFMAITFFTVQAASFVRRITDPYFKCLGAALSTILFVSLLYCLSESWIYSAGNVLAFVYYTVIVLTIRFRQLLSEKAR